MQRQKERSVSNHRWTGQETQWTREFYTTVKDGLYNGDVKFDYEGTILTGSAEHGIMKVIDKVDPNGKSADVVAYTEDKKAWLSYDDASTVVKAIQGFK